MKLKVTKKKARCKRVIAVLNNKLETLDLIREQTYPSHGDFAEGPITMAIVKKDSIEILIPIDCVIFLKDI